MKKFNNTYVMRDIFREYSKTDKTVSEKQFSNIIKTVNSDLIDYLLQGDIVQLPQSMGKIELRKIIPKTTLIGDKIHTVLPIDWKRTKQLWQEDLECRTNKTLIRFEISELFKLYYNKYTANYNNKSFYVLEFPRSVKRRLKELINKGVVDAPLLKYFRV